MLVLTRQKNESIILGDDIRLTIIDIEGDRVRVGIEAPKTLKIMRAELLDETRRVNTEAVQTDLSKLLGLKNTNQEETKDKE